MIRRTFIASMLSLALVFPGAAAAQKIVVGTGSDPAFTPAFFAAQTKLFQKHGLDVEVKLFATGSAAVSSLISGDINIALGVPAAALINHMKAPKIVMIGQYSTLRRNSELIGLKSIPDIPSLRGRKVGYQLGAAGEIFALEMLSQHGMTEKDITPVNLEPPEALAALQNNNIDAVFVFKPWSDRAVAALPDKIHKIPGTEAYSNGQYIMIDKEWAQKNPGIATRFLAAMRDATEQVQADKENAAKVVAGFLRMEASAVRPLLIDIHTFKLKFDNESVAIVKRELEMNKRAGRIGDGFSYEAFIWDAPLKQLDASLVNYTLPK